MERDSLERKPLYILYVGQSRNVADELQTLINENLATLIQTRNPGDGSHVRIDVVSNQRSAMKLVRNDEPHLVLLETGKINGDRLQFATSVRQRLPLVKLIEISFQRTLTPTIVDSYIKLPLSARQALEVIQRNCRPSHGHLVTFGPFTLDTAAHTLQHSDQHHHLRPKEVKLLVHLISHPNVLVKRSELMRTVWDTAYVGDTRTLDVHISQLRKYMGEDPTAPKYLLTERGLGYKLVVK